jgi:formylglycine-generating enzyme required for sulfatase activity
MNQPDGKPWNDRDGVPTLAPDAPLPDVAGPGVMIGNFQLQSLLGRGGMGEVWKAWDTKAERPVVLKLVPRELQRAVEEMARVRDTFRRVHALQHEHICPLYLLDEDPRFGWYLVMKFIDGQTLSSYRATYAALHGSFPVEQVVKVLGPVAEALDYAHGHKVIHRDIKPQNILVEGDADDVQVVDFGLAAEIRTTVSRYTQVQMETSGTRPYMAPEQWKGQIQDARTDQFALAVVAYELLAGHLPFESPDFDILRTCVLNDPPEGIEDQPEPVNRALLVGLGKRRQERFGSCVELVRAIEGGGVSAPVSVAPPAKPVGKPAEQFQAEAPASPAAASARPVRPQIPAVEKPRERITNSIGMELVLIPAGEYLMGSPNNDSEAFDAEKPQHKVRISKPFCLGVTPVTQGQYERVMANNPSHFKGDRQRPVEQVLWDQAVAFCRKLSELEGKKYRLPTEAEWEYACRAGSTGRWCFGEDESLLEQYAWYGENSGGTTHPVGQKKPNAWGLYDVHGNVWEWCSDWYGNYGATTLDDPTGPRAGSLRVSRGGSWALDARLCRSTFRNGLTPGVRLSHLGFRLACSSVDASGG